MVRWLLCSAVLLLSFEGLALPLCDGETNTVSAAAVKTTVTHQRVQPISPHEMSFAGMDEPEPVDEVNERVLIPCAFVESGVYGPVCLDASGYLITTQGVVLCEVRGLPDEGIIDEALAVEATPCQTALLVEASTHLGGVLHENDASKAPFGAACSTHVFTHHPLGPGRGTGAPPVPPA